MDSKLDGPAARSVPARTALQPRLGKEQAASSGIVEEARPEALVEAGSAAADVAVAVDLKVGSAAGDEPSGRARMRNRGGARRLQLDQDRRPPGALQVGAEKVACLAGKGDAGEPHPFARHGAGPFERATGRPAPGQGHSRGE